LEKIDYLIKQIKAGDTKAFEEVYTDYSGAIFGVIMKMLNNPEASADVLQDVFVKAWRKIDSYDPKKGRFYTWLYRIARNTTINHIRAKKPENLIGDIGVYDSRIGTQKLNEDTLDLKGKVAKLDTKYRQVVELIYFKGFTQKEAHQQLDIPIGTVKTRLRKAIQTLNSLYTDGNMKILVFLFLIWMNNG